MKNSAVLMPGSWNHELSGSSQQQAYFVVSESPIAYLQRQVGALKEATVRVVSSTADCVAEAFSSMNISCNIMRIVTSISTVVSRIFNMQEHPLVEKLGIFTDIIRLTRCFSYPDYVINGSLVQEVRCGRITQVASQSMWAVSDYVKTAEFLHPSLSSKNVISLFGRSMLVHELGNLSMAFASCCDVAITIQHIAEQRFMNLKDFFELISSVSTVIGSVLVLACVEARSTIAAMWALSGITHLVSRCIQKPIFC